MKRKMPSERQSIIRKLKLGELEGYITVGLYEDGTPGEIFLTFARMGSMERGLLNALAMVISKALQRGVPLADIVESLRHQKFEGGFTGDKDLPSADSIVDLISQWLFNRFVKENQK